MLKTLFLLLALANGVLFAYGQGYLASLFPTGREPARLNRQLNTDLLRLLPAEGGSTGSTPPISSSVTPPATASATEASAAPAVASGQPPAPPITPATPQSTPQSTAPSVAAPTQVAAGTEECVEIGNFNPDNAARFVKQLAVVVPGAQVAQRRIAEVVSHVVYIAPDAQQGAEAKLSELRALGITDAYVMQEAQPLRGGISLGVFKQEQAAREHLARLSRRGVRGARIGKRLTAVDLVALQVRGLDTQGQAKLGALRTDFPRQEERACNAG